MIVRLPVQHCLCLCLGMLSSQAAAVPTQGAEQYDRVLANITAGKHFSPLDHRGTARIYLIGGGGEAICVRSYLLSTRNLYI